MGAVSPLPSGRVIPDGWASRHIRAVGVGAMRGKCRIESAPDGPAPWPLPEGWEPAGAVLAADVPCRVQRINRAGTGAQGDQVQEVREYQVTVPVELVPDLDPTASGPWVVIESSPDDPHAAGARLLVRDMYLGTEVAERVLICRHNQTQD